MRRIDFYVQHLVRHNAHEVELASGKPVRFGFPTGSRMSNNTLDHRQLMQLVEEAAPPAALASLERERRASFRHAAAGIQVDVQVQLQADKTVKVLLVPTSAKAAAPAAPAAPTDAFERPLGGAMAGAPPAVASPAAAAPSAKAPAASAPEKRDSIPVPRVEHVPGEPEVNRVLREMVRLGASDLHLSSTVNPMVRLDGEMKALEGRTPLVPEELERMLMEICPERNTAEFKETNDTDFAHAIEGVARFRANYFMDRKGIGAVFRQIPFKILTVADLNLPQGVVDLCWLSKGLVVVTGPTGSGKSTTLAALVDYINENRSDHLITIEDPVEFVHGNKKCLVNQREVGVHTKSFKSALRAALREDPDIVLVGEMRDLETIAIAIETAETGHLVFGTLHTTSAKSTVDRIIDQFPTDRQEQIRVMLSESLRGVVAQVLCKKKGGGRVAGLEIMITNPAVSNLIREGKTFQLTSVMQTGRNMGMQTMNDHLLELVKAGTVEPQEAYLKSNDKQPFKDALKRLNINLDV